MLKTQSSTLALLAVLAPSAAQELGVDTDGQLTIPDDLKEFASLQNDIYLIGQGEYFEIWAPNFWAQQEAQLRDAEANASRFSALTVSAHSSAVAA